MEAEKKKFRAVVISLSPQKKVLEQYRFPKKKIFRAKGISKKTKVVEQLQFKKNDFASKIKTVQNKTAAETKRFQRRFCYLVIL